MVAGQDRDWTPQEQRYAAAYLRVCREVRRLLPPDEARALLNSYGSTGKYSMAQVESAWAREKHRRGL